MRGKYTALRQLDRRFNHSIDPTILQGTLPRKVAMEGGEERSVDGGCNIDNVTELFLSADIKCVTLYLRLIEIVILVYV